MQCAALVGEDHPLCPDLPELDLSELDVNDLDADSFLGGLKWYSDQSENISNQYSNESSNIFEVWHWPMRTGSLLFTSLFIRIKDMTAWVHTKVYQWKLRINLHLFNVVFLHRECWEMYINAGAPRPDKHLSPWHALRGLPLGFLLVFLGS